MWENLYHPIHNKGEQFLKWASLWKLGEIFCRPKGLDLVRVVCCTAVPQDDIGKRDRHNSFNAAQIACGVTVLKGHHVFDPDSGKRSEKQSDINVALSLMMDAEDDVFDWAFLLSADSDQAATAKFFSERHPKKALIGVAPPTKNVPDKVMPYCISHFVMSFDHVEEAIMPAMVPGLSGNLIRRPAEYARPDWWVHPDDRPRKRPSPKFQTETAISVESGYRDGNVIMGAVVAMDCGSSLQVTDFLRRPGQNTPASVARRNNQVAAISTEPQPSVAIVASVQKRTSLKLDGLGSK